MDHDKWSKMVPGGESTRRSILIGIVTAEFETSLRPPERSAPSDRSFFRVFRFAATAIGFAGMAIAVVDTTAVGQQSPPAQPVASRTDATADPGKAIAFSDKPDFSVAGVTDWTAVGGHGSDATLRTSESLARETLTLPGATTGLLDKPGAVGDDSEARLRAAVAAAPRDYAANRDLGEYLLQRGRYADAAVALSAAFTIDPRRPEEEYSLAQACRGVGELTQAKQHVQHAMTEMDLAEFHRLMGELDEATGDPLAAVQELQRATQMDASEENYFAWGSELLLHRAVWQAAEVFGTAVKAYPASARLKTAWGTALFAGALYEQAAEQLCAASDLRPEDAETYRIMGKVELASPQPLPCVEKRLGRFAAMQPENADANFLDAMVLAKQDRSANRDRVRELLKKVTEIDPGYGDAYLQLGILAFAEKQYSDAVGLYTKAVVAEPKESEAHYRLALTYERLGEGEKAKEELRLHDALETARAEAAENERRQIKQFVIATNPDLKTVAARP